MKLCLLNAGHEGDGQAGPWSGVEVSEVLQTCELWLLDQVICYEAEAVLLLVLLDGVLSAFCLRGLEEELVGGR